MSIPKVFISYSHDSLEHKRWVLKLAIRLRNNGIDSIIDQWDLKPGDDLPHFMESQLEHADYIIMICSSAYVKKANEGKGGVGYEKMIITSNLLSRIDQSKIIPIVRSKDETKTPTFLKTKLYIDLSDEDNFEYNFDELIRTIHKRPLYDKPIIGTNPFKEQVSTEDFKLSKALKELMIIVVRNYQEGKNYVTYDLIQSELDLSRIFLEILIGEAVRLGYISLDTFNDLYLEDKGKVYAFQNKLIE